MNYETERNYEVRHFTNVSYELRSVLHIKQLQAALPYSKFLIKMKHVLMIGIGGRHRKGIDVTNLSPRVSIILGCDNVHSGRYLQTFRDNLLPLFSGQKCSRYLRNAGHFLIKRSSRLLHVGFR
jgi:hypothetical protein